MIMNTKFENIENLQSYNVFCVSWKVSILDLSLSPKNRPIVMG